VDILASIVSVFGKDLSPGRMFESVVLLVIIWSRLRPHLKVIEDRLGGVENAVKVGFEAGNQRFKIIENRIMVLEKGILKGDSNEKSSSI
jgi:hypothetical protein